MRGSRGRAKSWPHDTAVAHREESMSWPWTRNCPSRWRASKTGSSGPVTVLPASSHSTLPDASTASMIASGFHAYCTGQQKAQGSCQHRQFIVPKCWRLPAALQHPTQCLLTTATACMHLRALGCCLQSYTPCSIRPQSPGLRVSNKAVESQRRWVCTCRGNVNKQHRRQAPASRTCLSSPWRVKFAPSLIETPHHRETEASCSSARPRS